MVCGQVLLGLPADANVRTVKQSVNRRAIGLGAVLLALLASFDRRLESDENLAPNGNFEMDLDRNALPDRWVPYPYTEWGKSLFWSEDALSGKRSLKIISNGEVNRLWTTFIRVEPISTYRVTFFLKGKIVTRRWGTAGVKLIELDDKDKTVKELSPQGKLVPKQKEIGFTGAQPISVNKWKKYESRLSTSPITQKLQVIFQMPSCSGELLLDNFSIVKEPSYNPVPGTDRLPGEWVNRVAFGIETPHIKWARPYYGGTLKIFALIPNPGKREIIELFQRFDSQIEVVVAYAPSYLGVQESLALWEGTSQTEKIKELSKKLEADYDVYLIGTFLWAELPIEMRYLIFKKVSRGKGLVIVSRQPSLTYELELLLRHRLPRSETDELLQGIPWRAMRWGFTEPTSGFTPAPDTLPELIVPCTISRGRALLINYPYPERFWYIERRGR